MDDYFACGVIMAPGVADATGLIVGLALGFGLGVGAGLVLGLGVAQFALSSVLWTKLLLADGEGQGDALDGGLVGAA